MAKTFEFQTQLSTLPLSNLDDANKNFLDWVEPLLTNEEFNISKNNLENFIKNEGPILHDKLVEYSKQNDGSWLAPLWRDMYLDIREPVAIDVNYFVKIITKDLKDKYSANSIAATIITKLTDIYERIMDESFEPEMIKTTPLCMSAYKEMFKATRIPKQSRDEYIVKEQTKKEHIIIMYKNNMFKMDLTDNEGQRYSTQNIKNTLDVLLTEDIQTNELSMGILTTAYRNEAAEILEKLIKFPTNENNFEELKDALFMVCMDEDSKDLNDFGKTLISANENNRYFDKNLQLIFNQKGDFGFNLEHTGADAGTWINVINKINEELKSMDKYLDENIKDKINIDKLTWDLNEIEEDLKKVAKKHKEKSEDLNFEIINTDFGNKKIKSLKYSPDAFLHLALQLAQYRTFGELKSTYEAVATRIYLNGRTECNRPISNELVEFVKAFNKNENTNELKELMSAACNKHSSRIKACLGSNGIERYFYGLKNMYILFSKELGLEKMPEFFADEAYKKLTYSYISTSRIESKYFDLGGFGPVVEDGFGFWYNLLEDEINMNLITRKSVNEKNMKIFADEILKALNDLVDLASK